MHLNILLQTVSNNELELLDPYGTGLSIISITIVFVVLISLYLIFRTIGKLFQSVKKRRVKKGNIIKVNNKNTNEPDGEVCAAIAMALYCYNLKYHDNENAILTIKKISNDYSPWSSKIYGLRKTVK